MATDSDDYLSDDRKRKGREYSSPFKSSKKILRSPSQRTIEVMDEEKEEEDIRSLIQTVLKEVKEIRKENKEFKEEMKNLNKENVKLRKELEEAKQKLQIMEGRLEHLEKNMRKNNVVITGIQLDTTGEVELKNKMFNFFKQNLKEEVKIEKAMKLGPTTCLLQLKENEEKRKIMEKKRDLRFLRNEKVYINDDMTALERKIQKEVRDKCKELREQGKNVKIGFKKLTVNGEVWKWDRNGIMKDMEKN